MPENVPVENESKKQEWLNTSRKKITFGLSILLVFVLIIVFFATDLHYIVFQHQNYEIYKCAKEGVRMELAYPDTASFPALGKVSIRKSAQTTQFIINSYTGGGQGNVDKAWDVSGNVKCENALGMECNVRFQATVILQYGKYKCYEVTID